MKIYLAMCVLLTVCLSKLQADNAPMNRQQVAANAVAHVNIGAWTASTNTYTFAHDKVFQSKYSVGVKYTQFNWPYVYGGRETDETTTSRINSGTCPGGASGDPNTRTIYNWAGDSSKPARHLAGIDCIGFVMKMINITDQNTLINTNAAGFGTTYCVPVVDPTKLQPGDVLVSANHIKMVTGVSPLEVTEANGSPGLQRVATQKKDIGAYAAYTPFPIFPSITPGPGDTVGMTPEIKVTIKSATNIDDDNVYMEVDGDKVTPVITSYSKDTKQMTLSYTPSADNALASGDHQIYVYAENDLSLADDITSSFNVKEDSATWTGTISGTVITEKYIDGKPVSIEHPFKIQVDCLDDIDINKLKASGGIGISMDEYKASVFDLAAKMRAIQAAGGTITPDAVKDLQSNTVASRTVAGKCNTIIDIPDEGTHIVDKQTIFSFNIVDKLSLTIGSPEAYSNNYIDKTATYCLLVANIYAVNVVDDSTIEITSWFYSGKKSEGAFKDITNVSGKLTRDKNNKKQ